MIKLREIVMIHELKQQGPSIAEISRRLGRDPKTVRKYINTGMEPPVYGPRCVKGSLLDPFKNYLRERISAYPGLSAKRLLREIKELDYQGSYTILTDFLRTVRPVEDKKMERRFETPPGRQAQVDFAQFRVEFSDEPGIARNVWLFSMVLGHSRWLWGKFCASQDTQTVLRCHIEAFSAMKGCPREVLYDRMKTAVIGEDAEGRVVYNNSLLALLNHYGVIPRACKPYRAKTKGKVERPFRYIRQDFFLARTFKNMDDLNRQFRQWLCEIANVRLHATTNRIVSQHFAEEVKTLLPLPEHPYDAVLTIERRVTKDGFISVGSNLYSVPDTTRKRQVEVQHHPRHVKIYQDGQLIAEHPVIDGKKQRRLDPGHRKSPPVQKHRPAGQDIVIRDLTFYDAVAQRLAAEEARS